MYGFVLEVHLYKCMLKLILGEIYLDKNVQLELYTRPTCSDCQGIKGYLNSQEIGL